MEHEQAQRLFRDYFEGRLAGAQAREFQQHLKSCEPCRTRVRLESARVRGTLQNEDRGLASPAVQEQMARNRDLLIKILLLAGLAFFVWKMKR
jgi:hypothetical protein